MKAKRGLYCGPLRLLAMEIYDTCNAAGTYCNLITGRFAVPKQLVASNFVLDMIAESADHS